jgi:hypothetical protein
VGTSGQAVWIKSTYSIGAGACIELAVANDGIALRNSRDPGNVLLFTPEEVIAFLRGVRAGEFDHLVEPS